MQRSIRLRIALAVGLPFLAVWAGMTLCEYRIQRRELVAAMTFHLTELTSRQAAQLDVELSKAEQLADSLAAVLQASPDIAEQHVNDLIRGVLDANPEAFGVGILFSPGKDKKWFAPYYFRDPPNGYHFLDLTKELLRQPYPEWCRAGLTENRAAWTEPYFDDEAGRKMMCTYNIPWRRDGNTRGAVLVDMLAEHFLDDILRVRGGQEYSVLISRQGKFISHPDPTRIMKQADFWPALNRDRSDKSADLVDRIGGAPGVCEILDSRTGLNAWMVHAPVPSAGWSLVAIIPEREVLAPVTAQLVRSAVVLVAGCFVMLVIIWLVSARVTNPIRRLTAAAESLAGGDLETHVPNAAGSDEIARLARTFNTMVASLKTNIECRVREEASRKQVEGELHAGRKIQAALLPAMLPDEPERRFSLHAVNEPAKTVAGDFFDFFFLDERTLAVVIADVSGKGIPAAIYMAVSRTMLRDFVSRDKSPAEVVDLLNRTLALEDHDGMFVTLLLGYYDVESGELTYANAGHCPPYVVRADGRIESLDPTGPLVGPFYDSTYRDEQRRLEPGDSLVLFTDGVTEAVSPDREFYGEPKLESLLETLAGRKADAVCRAILDSVNTFSAADLSDDATVLVLARTT